MSNNWNKTVQDCAQKHRLLERSNRFSFKEWSDNQSAIPQTLLLLHPKIDYDTPVSSQLKDKRVNHISSNSKDPIILRKKRPINQIQIIVFAYERPHSCAHRERPHTCAKQIYLCQNTFSGVTFNDQACCETNHCPCSINCFNSTFSL